MKRYFLSLAFTILFSNLLPAQNDGTGGSFTRLGFGARGMGMGNALTAVREGAVQTYYNPSLASFSEQRTGSLTTSFLSFDRYLNFLSYTQAVQPTAGISGGIINSGVRNIDGRDANGNHTDYYSTTDNEFYLAFANRMTENLSLGVSVKLFYSKLFDQISTTTVGFDIGAFYRLSPEWNIGGVIQDVGTKYKWDSKPIYDIDGKIVTDNFPQLRRLGVCYAPASNIGIIALDFENSSEGSNMIKIGAEINFVPSFTVRGGVDRWILSGNNPGAKPTFGFSLNNSFTKWTPSITYAYVVEPFSPQNMHILTLSAMF
ncbi:MAG: PorV/PorQ family protein [Bacteroidota bacterium]